MKRSLLILLALATLLSICGCGNGVRSTTFFLMDTSITVTLYTNNGTLAEDIFAECREILVEYDALWSRTKPESDVSKWNSSENGDVTLDARTLSLLQTALAVSEDTDGAFDVTVAPFVELWSTCEADGRLPTDEEMEAALTLTGYEKLTLTDTTLKKPFANMRIDLGGIGKGAAIEALIAYLETSGVDGGLVSFGSNVAVFGAKPDGAAFRVALRDPKDAGGTVGVMTLQTGEILSVSGDYERFVMIDGIKYHHLLDPESGYPAEKGLASVAVIARDGALADALSTALFVMGRDEALAFYESGVYAFEAILIACDGSIDVTKGFFERFGENK